MNPTAYEQVAALFEQELRQRGIFFSRNEDGTYHVEASPSYQPTVHLGNLAREWEKEPAADMVHHFVRVVLDSGTFSDTSWETARAGIYFCLFPTEDLKDPSWQGLGPLRDELSPGLAKLYAYDRREAGTTVWISGSDLAHWGVTAEEIRALAMQHMNEKMRQAEVDFIDVGTRRIAILGTEETNLKASLMLTEEFARRMKAEFTWPVYTLVPADDYMFIVPTDDEDLLNRAAGAAMREYERVDLPLSREIFKISDEGVRHFATIGGSAG